MNSKYLIDLEKKALKCYQKSIEINREQKDIVQDISECSEALFKSICIIKYAKKENDPEINIPILFLEKKKFFGKKHSQEASLKEDKSNEKFAFHTPKLGIVKKHSEHISAIANPKKHNAYFVTEEDVTIAVAAIKSILKWYFTEQNDHTEISLSTEEALILKTLYTAERKATHIKTGVVTGGNDEAIKNILIISGIILLIAFFIYSTSKPKSDGVRLPFMDTVIKHDTIIKLSSPTNSITESQFNNKRQSDDVTELVESNQIPLQNAIDNNEISNPSSDLESQQTPAVSTINEQNSESHQTPPIISNTPPVIKDCEKNKTGNFYFQNNTKDELQIQFVSTHNQYFNQTNTVQSGEKTFFYDIAIGPAFYVIRNISHPDIGGLGYTSTTPSTTKQGSVFIEQCLDNTFIIK